MKKEYLVNRINELLEMEHRLSHWQFLQVRKYELQEMVSKIEELYSRANGGSYTAEVTQSTCYKPNIWTVRTRRKGTNTYRNKAI